MTHRTTWPSSQASGNYSDRGSIEATRPLNLGVTAHSAQAERPFRVKLQLQWANRARARSDFATIYAENPHYADEGQQLVALEQATSG